MDQPFASESCVTVPILDIYGSNWPAFKDGFKSHLRFLHLDAHFDAQNYPPESYEEIEAKPIKKATESNGDFEKRLAGWKGGEEEWTERRKAWMQDDAKAILALGSVIPDYLFVEISENKRFCEIWKVLEAWIELTAPSHRSNLKRRLNQMYCTEQDDIMAHLEDMEKIYQELASRDAKISDEDYIDAILPSLPESYLSPMISLLMAYSSTNLPITPAMIKGAIQREYEARQRAASAHNKRSNEITQHDARGRAPERGQGRGKRRGSSRVGGDRDQSGLICFNCGGKGHKAAVCPSPKKPPRGRSRHGQQ